jgi:L-iditol 2-dehydrogenase
MKRAVWYNNQDIRIEDVPQPVPGPDEMLVKILSCGICGSDLAEWYRLPRAPLVPGHEIGGEIVETGTSVKKYKPGDRVCIVPKIPCNECSYCTNGHFPVCPNVKERLPGGFAEYVLVPPSFIEHGTYLLPDVISYNQSTFIEPLACVVRAQRLAGLRENQTVMILGCGTAGLLHVKCAAALDCRIIATDINAKRLAFAQKAGAAQIMDMSQPVTDGDNGLKADVVIICTSALSAIKQAWKHVDKGGAVVFFAVPGPEKQVVIPINDFWTHEVRVMTSYYCGPSDIKEAIRFIETGTVEVDDMITHELPLDDILKGYKLAQEGTESLKVIIKPNQNN